MLLNKLNGVIFVQMLSQPKKKKKSDWERERERNYVDVIFYGSLPGVVEIDRKSRPVMAHTHECALIHVGPRAMAHLHVPSSPSNSINQILLTVPRPPLFLHTVFHNRPSFLAAFYFCSKLYSLLRTFWRGEKL